MSKGPFGSATSQRESAQGYGQEGGGINPRTAAWAVAALLLTSCGGPAVAQSPLPTNTPNLPPTPKPTETPTPEDYVGKGKTFMSAVLNEYFTSLPEAEQKTTAASLDGATISTVMVTKNGLSYTPERNYVGDHILTMSAIRSKSGQLSFLFYDLTSVQDRARLVDIRRTPDGHIVGVDRKTGQVLLTIDDAYQMDDKDRPVLNPSAVVQMKWNGSDKFQDLRVEVDANHNPLQGELVSGQIKIAENPQPSRDQIALENETKGGAGKGLLSIVNRNRADLPILDPKTEGVYIPSLKEKGLNPFIPAVERSSSLNSAVDSYVRAMNSAKKAGEPTLESAKVKEGLVVQQLTDTKGNPFFVAVTADGTPLMIAEQKDGEWGWEASNLRFWIEKTPVPFKFGFSIAPIKEDKSKTIVPKNANIIAIGGTSFDWLSSDKNTTLNPSRQYIADEWIRFAQNNNFAITPGNYLVYHSEYPTWLAQGHYKPEELKKILLERVRKTILAFPEIDTWYVVNETLGYYQGNTYFENKTNRAISGQDILDLNFMIQLFTEARSAAQEVSQKTGKPVRLALNDYTNLATYDASQGRFVLDNSVLGPKADFIEKVVRELASRGLIDTVGLQFHFYKDEVPSEKDIIKAVERYDGIVQVDITELDTQNPESYYRIISALLKAKNVRSITIWGVNQEAAWSPQDHLVYLFSNNNPTASYYAASRAFFDHLSDSQTIVVSASK